MKVYNILPGAFDLLQMIQASTWTIQVLRIQPVFISLSVSFTFSTPFAGREIYSLLVTNYAELEEVLNDILDESGPILKTTLAKVTQAVAIDNLASIVSGLGNVKRYLRDIQTRTNQLQVRRSLFF